MAQVNALFATALWKTMRTQHSLTVRHQNPRECWDGCSSNRPVTASHNEASRANFGFESDASGEVGNLPYVMLLQDESTGTAVNIACMPQKRMQDQLRFRHLC